MSHNKFTLEVNLKNVSSLLKNVHQESDGMTIYSNTMSNQGLRWYAGVKIVKPKHTTKLVLSALLYCLNPIFDKNLSWKSNSAVKMTLVKLNSSDQAIGFTKECSFTFENKSASWGWENFMAFDDFMRWDYVKDNQALIRIDVEPGVPSFGLPAGQKNGLLADGPSLYRFRNIGKPFNVALFTEDGQSVKAHKKILSKTSPAFCGQARISRVFPILAF